jgi:hypothetical protein
MAARAGGARGAAKALGPAGRATPDGGRGRPHLAGRRSCRQASNDLPAADAAAVPLFQRLRIASRACYVTDPDILASVEAWMQRAFAE